MALMPERLLTNTKCGFDFLRRHVGGHAPAEMRPHLWRCYACFNTSHPIRPLAQTVGRKQAGSGSAQMRRARSRDEHTRAPWRHPSPAQKAADPSENINPLYWPTQIPMQAEPAEQASAGAATQIVNP